jgi:ankyrin repeat protein
MTTESTNLADASLNTNPTPIQKGTYPQGTAGRDLGLVDILFSSLKQRPSAERLKTLRAIQLVAAAVQPLQASELLCASKTEIPRHSDHGIAAARHQPTQISSLQDLIAACKGMLKVDTAGTVDFCHDGMRALVSSTWFLQRFQLQNSDEIFAAICIQHLGCARDTTETISWPGEHKCPVDGYRPCQLRHYADASWREHYNRLKGASQWIDSLLHKLIIAPFSKDSVVHMECDQRCNRVLATGMQMAAVHNITSLTAMYLEMGAAVNSCNHATATALQVAVAKSSTAVVELLLDRGADPNSFACDALDLRVSCNQMDAALPSSLVKCCPNHGQCHCWRCCSIMRGLAPLHVAALVGHEDTLKVLVKKGANIRSRTKHLGDTPLHLASRAGNIGAVLFLIDLGADVEARNSHGERAFVADTARQGQASLGLRTSRIFHAPRETKCTVGAIACQPRGDELNYVTKMKSISLEDGPPGRDGSSRSTKASSGFANRKRCRMDDLQIFAHRTRDEGSWTLVENIDAGAETEFWGDISSAVL